MVSIGARLLRTQLVRAAIPNLDRDTKDHDSYLGTPVYDSVIFGKLNERNAYYDLQGNEIQYQPISFDEVLMDVSQQKNIISTPIQGKNGTFKQYISDGDYVINITGRVSGTYRGGKNWQKNGKYYPETELLTLIDICKAGYTIPISSYFLNRVFGIFDIVITGYRLPITEGDRYSQQFEINCLSDREFILEFTEEDVNDSETLRNILNE